MDGYNLQALRLRSAYKQVANGDKLPACHIIASASADKFASEWAPVLSSSHRPIAVEELLAAFVQFTTIPMEQRLNCFRQ